MAVGQHVYGQSMNDSAGLVGFQKDNAIKVPEPITMSDTWKTLRHMRHWFTICNSGCFHPFWTNSHIIFDIPLPLWGDISEICLQIYAVFLCCDPHMIYLGVSDVVS